MKGKSIGFLKQLMAAMSPTGTEVEAALVWKEEAAPFCDEVRGDSRGNSYAVLGKGNSPRIMLAGHIDEIGLSVTYIDDDGFLYFNTLGGWDSQVLVGQRVIFQGREGKIRGVIGRKPIHQIKEEDRKLVAKVEDLWVDMGFKNKKEAQKFIRIGDPGVVDQGYQELQGNNIVSRGLDDRIGAFVALEVLRMLAPKKPKSEITAVATVQEEIGHYGAIIGAYELNPTVAFVVEVGHASDYPTVDKKQIGEHKLGSGPILGRGPMINPVLWDMLTSTAEENEIPYTVRSMPSRTSTDTDGISISRSGVPSALVSIPNRYMHSPNEMVNLDDVENAIKLIALTAAKINSKTCFVPK